MLPKKVYDAFFEGSQGIGMPIGPQSQERERSTPRLIFIEPETINVGEITHTPDRDEDIIDAEIID